MDDRAPSAESRTVGWTFARNGTGRRFESGIAQLFFTFLHLDPLCHAHCCFAYAAHTVRSFPSGVMRSSSRLRPRMARIAASESPNCSHGAYQIQSCVPWKQVVGDRKAFDVRESRPENEETPGTADTIVTACMSPCDSETAPARLQSFLTSALRQLGKSSIQALAASQPAIPRTTHLLLRADHFASHRTILLASPPNTEV